MRIRNFRTSDRDACLSLFDSNTPKYFHPDERPLFFDCLATSRFLPPRLNVEGAPDGHMYVVEVADLIAGCGGWFLDGSDAVLSWGIVHRSFHGKGIGRFLLSERLGAIRDDGRAESVRVRTTPLVQGFFERAGFTVAHQHVNGLIDGIPLVELSLTL